MHWLMPGKGGWFRSPGTRTLAWNPKFPDSVQQELPGFSFLLNSEDWLGFVTRLVHAG